MALSLFVLGNFIYQFTMGDARVGPERSKKVMLLGCCLPYAHFYVDNIVFLFSEDILELLPPSYHQEIFGGDQRSLVFLSGGRFLSTVGHGYCRLCRFSACCTHWLKGSIILRCLNIFGI